MKGYKIRGIEVDLQTFQLQRLNELLVYVSRFNEFYKEKLKNIHLPIISISELQNIPMTTKKELVLDQQLHPPLGKNHTYPQGSYIRYHQTSGTTGRPLKVLDNTESWEWWSNCWVEVLQNAGVTSLDRAYLAFSYGPFIGFWAAHEGVQKLGALAIPGGSMTSEERLNSLIENNATVLLCTPSYALHLAEVANNIGTDIKNSSIHTIITAGEPGGSITTTRSKIESLWGAKLYDHVGMTEMGAYGYSCTEQKGLHINEAEFIAEIINPETGKLVKPNEKGELVLTNLGRFGYPIIRYRTGDIVNNIVETCACGNPYKFLPEGIIGRSDDMVVIRGMNIYPSSIESIIREFEDITEFRIIYYTHEEMDQIKVQIEASKETADHLTKSLRKQIGLRVTVEMVPINSLERFMLKAKRIIDQRLKSVSV
ncbi:phenylacetate--CoA ligase family protein [Rummeliibacillus sp. NPDC094406]|uniref:phenylacetate--CoA ligase family protein n=1 Tax=Rummeliibacillus sp. NPDC094406 TaxID=3364511 RepID=UPI00380408EE